MDAELTDDASSVFGVTTAMIEPVLSIQAPASLTPGTRRSACTTSDEALSTFNACAPERALSAKSASNVVSNSRIPSSSEGSRSCLVITLRLTFPVMDFGMPLAKIRHCGHLDGGKRLATCCTICRIPGTCPPFTGTTKTPTTS